MSRESVHRWQREHYGFRAALNRVRADTLEAVLGSLIAAASAASRNVAQAIEDGDIKVSLQVLKGLGLLDGAIPELESDDPDLLAREAEVEAREQRQQLAQRYLFSGDR